MSALKVYGGRTYGKKTAAAGTAIVLLVEPKKGYVSRIQNVTYTAVATAHTLTCMRPLAVTTFTADAAASQADVVIAANPGTYSALATAPVCRTADNGIAANDYVAWEYPDGTFGFDTVSAWTSGTKTITLANNLATGGVKSGGKLWFFGIITDTNPNDAQAHPQLTLPASATTHFGVDPTATEVGILASIPGNTQLGLDARGSYEPLLLHSGNATNAGVLESVTVAHCAW